MSTKNQQLKPDVRSDPLMTERETAEMLRIKPRTLADWRARGVGPKFVRLTGRGVLYRVSSVSEFLDSREVESTSELSFRDALK